MKIRSSIQIFRSDSKKEPARPTTATYLRIPGSRSATRLDSQADEKKQQSAQQAEIKPPQHPDARDVDVKQEQPFSQDAGIKSTPSKAMQDFLQKTGAGLRATGASLKARSAKLERRIPRKKAKAKAPSRRSSTRNSLQPHRTQTVDLSDATLDRLTRSPKERKATEAFLEKQRARANTRERRRTNSQDVSPMSSRSQAELDRRPLAPLEVEAMFLGAPRYGVSQEEGVWKVDVEVRGGGCKVAAGFGKDFDEFGHQSFAACTLERTKSKEVVERSGERHSVEGVKPSGGLVEVPNMLSGNGLDVGAVGIEHFLQLQLDDEMDEKEKDVTEKRKQLLLDPEWIGLKDLNMEHLIDRLTEMGELYAAIRQHEWEEPEPWNRSRIEEMGEELFGKMLSSELGTTEAGTGSVTLKTQIAALQRVLNTKGLWRDFGKEEWRCRVGQVLWSPEEAVGGWIDGARLPSERDVLLLQITLAAELFMRLLAQEALSSSFPPLITQEEADALESQRGTKIKWDLVLAERFLDNLQISAKTPLSNDEKKANRGSFFSMISFFSAKESLDEREEQVQPVLFAKHETEQLDGLAYFADQLQWPHASDVKTDLEIKLAKSSRSRPISTAASIYATPLSSPKFFPPTPGGVNHSNPYFSSARPGFSRANTATSISLLTARNIAGNVESHEVGGWLSRSWLSGLVMPGEAARHFLMAALLENSPQAIAVLGEDADLSGGFVYGGKGFWSKRNVVGRVLGAGRAAKECMGWISATAFDGVREGWFGVAVKDLPETKPAALTDAGVVAKRSDPLLGHKIESLQAGDFTRPADGPLVMGNEVRFEGLSFSNSKNSGEDQKEEGDPVAILTFSSPINSKLPSLEVSLTYDVQFISSYPCHPQATRPRTHSRPMTPSVQLSFEQASASTTKLSDSGVSSSDKKAGSKTHHPSKPSSSSTTSFHAKEKELPSLPTHPLHIDYRYSIIAVAALLSMPETQRPRRLSEAAQRTVMATESQADAAQADDDEEVVVLDCRGSEELELLARAWCAKIGEHALIGKSGRTCLSCCVREARGLGLGVVIRI